MVVCVFGSFQEFAAIILRACSMLIYSPATLLLFNIASEMLLVRSITCPMPTQKLLTLLLQNGSSAAGANSFFSGNAADSVGGSSYAGIHYSPCHLHMLDTTGVSPLAGPLALFLCMFCFPTLCMSQERLGSMLRCYCTTEKRQAKPGVYQRICIQIECEIECCFDQGVMAA